MPNIWTHNLFGEQIARQQGSAEILDDPALRALFRLGCQGPDFLFYHRFLPWQGKSKLNRLGSLMHQTHCGPVLVAMAEAARNGRAKPSDPLAVYVLGFLMHHVLDRNMHPFVFCKSGFRKWDHQRYEVILDTLVVRKFLGLETWRTPVWKEIDCGARLPDEVVLMLDRIAAKHYPEFRGQISAGEWNEAYRDMIRAQRLFHDPYGIKRALTFGRIEPLVYKRRNADLDYLNESRAEWRHPAVPEETSRASFWDLWELALEDGRRVWSAAAAYMFAEPGAPAAAEREELRRVLGNRSYEHGKPCDLGLEIRHAEPVWA